jgi:hypothetical protein
VVGSSVLSIPASIVPIPDSLLNFQRSFVHSRCVERACATMCWDGRCVLSMVAVPECVLTMRLIPWGFQPCLLVSPQIAPEVCDWAAQESDRHIIYVIRVVCVSCAGSRRVKVLIEVTNLGTTIRERRNCFVSWYE